MHLVSEQFSKPMRNEREFQHKLFLGLIHTFYEFQGNNTDFLRSRMKMSSRINRRLQDKFLLLAKRISFIRRDSAIENIYRNFMFILHNIDNLENVYYLLEDEYSRELLIYLLQFKILGAQHIKLPVNNKQYWDKYTSIDKSFLKERYTFRAGDWYLNLYEFQGYSNSIIINAHSLAILNTFVLEQYAYKKGDIIIQVQPGDTVIDAGGGWGDTALYFADRVGLQGAVYCFEFGIDNLKIFQQNMNLNQHLGRRIKLVTKALWNKSGEVVSYYPNGPATSLDNEQRGTMKVSTLSIDDFVKEKGIARVDYIKMDIEGSELRALRGAEETIRTFMPTLAISLYHRKEHFIEIPDYLNKLDLHYEFFLDHFTIRGEETVLFARPATNSLLSHS